MEVSRGCGGGAFITGTPEVERWEAVCLGDSSWRAGGKGLLSRLLCWRSVMPFWVLAFLLSGTLPHSLNHPPGMLKTRACTALSAGATESSAQCYMS